MCQILHSFERINGVKDIDLMSYEQPETERKIPQDLLDGEKKHYRIYFANRAQ